MLQDRIPVSGDMYKHFKGNVYEIITSKATYTDTGEDMVIYKPYGGSKYYVRRLEEFLSEVDKEKYPDSNEQWRFTFIINKNDKDFTDTYVIDNEFLPVIQIEGYKMVFYGFDNDEEINKIIPEVVDELKYYKRLIHEYLMVSKFGDKIYIIRYSHKLRDYIKEKPGALEAIRIINKSGKELIPDGKSSKI